jgi:hypothetical protein
VVEVSGENAYSVKPLALVSTVALPISAVLTLSAAAAAGLLPPPGEEAAEGVLGEPHATQVWDGTVPPAERLQELKGLEFLRERHGPFDLKFLR